MKKPLIIQLTEALAHFSRREKLILYAAALVVAVMAIDRVIVRTATGKLSGLDEQIKVQESQVLKDLRIVALKEAIELARAQYSSYLVRQKSESEETTALLKEIQGYADKIGFAAFDMKPSGSQEKGKLKISTVTVNCEGTMEQLLSFMFSIETSTKRLMAIEKYQLTPKSRDTHLVKASLTISCLYVL